MLITTLTLVYMVIFVEGFVRLNYHTFSVNKVREAYEFLESVGENANREDRMLSSIIINFVVFSPFVLLFVFYPNTITLTLLVIMIIYKIFEAELNKQKEVINSNLYYIIQIFSGYILFEILLFTLIYEMQIIWKLF